MIGVLYTDGACKGNPGPASIGIVLKDEYGHTIATHAQLIGHSTNNVAEYTALNKGLDIAKEKGITDLRCYADSLLMVNHVNNKKDKWSITNPVLVNHMNEIKNKLQGFDNVCVNHVRRHYNKEADEQANIAFRQQKAEQQVFDSL